MRIAIVLVLACLLGGCSSWSQKDTATAGKVVRCLNACASACVRELQQATVCPAPATINSR